jgi:hypothetical protein
MRFPRAQALIKRAIEIGYASLLVRRRMSRGPRHMLDAPLVVSLTSHPPRFKTLHLTLRSLLNQSVSPDHLVLWLADGDEESLPQEVLSLRRFGLEIRKSENYRSATKIIPAIRAFPDAYIVTADDDIYYPRAWLKTLIASALPSTQDIVSYVVRRPIYRGDEFAPVADWNVNLVDETTQTASDDLFATGYAGVLYPPRSLHSDVLDGAAFMELCPTCDDSWIAWMARRQGTLVRRPDAPRWAGHITWLGTNAGSLSSQNLFNPDSISVKQDEINRRMAEHFGPLNKLKSPPGEEIVRRSSAARS